MDQVDAPLFDELWDYQDPAGTEARLLARLPAAEAGGDRDYLAQLLTQLARTHSLRGQFDPAQAYLDRAEGLAGPELAVARVRLLLERGRCYNSAGDPARARPLFRQAFELAQDAGADFFAVDAAHMLGIAAATPEEQIAWDERALARAESATGRRTRQWLGPLYNNMGWSYHDAGDYERALTLFRRSLHWRETEAAPRQEGPIRIARWSVARALRSLGRLEEALAEQQALAEAWAAAGGEDGYVHEEIGECLLALERAEEAREHFRQAYRLLAQDRWLTEHEAPRLERLRQLGDESGPVQ